MQSGDEYWIAYGLYFQQLKHLMKRGMIAPNPRKEVLKELKRLVEEHHSQGGGVVLMMDANEDW